ncbi:MAG: S24 family peptidase, partial [Acidobacteria bacterium]|nr:S24 family peptidase [Acidobacteriota bacterium]
PVRNAGVLLLDPVNDRLYLRFRRDWPRIAPAEDWEVLEALAADLEAKSREMGGARFLEWLESGASNAIRVTDREEMMLASFEARLERLYKEHVVPTVLRYETHLPRYSFRAAAGRFGEEMEVDPEEWEEVPADLRLTEDLFVGHVTGHSMEPRIPSGSLCIFRSNVTGSRNQRLLLVENYGLPEHGGRYTVKRYRSEKHQDEDGWRHERITLEPLNPAYESWDLEEGSFRVIAEFVRVLRVEEEDLL